MRLGLLDLALQFLQICDDLLFALPGQLHAVHLLAQLGDLGLDLGQALAGGFVGLLGQRRLFHQVAGQAAFQLVDGLGQRFQLHLQAAGGLVDQVDGLVRELSPRNVAVREPRRRHQSIVADADAVVDLVALFQAAQDRHRVVHRRLAHEYRLKPSLQRLVLLDALAVFVERRGADAAQIAARQGRLEHVGRVDRALGRARADQGVQLVDEEDDLALGRRDLLQHRLEPVLELAAKLGARHQRAEIERQDALALERFGHVAGRDPLGDAFDDGGLAHAWLADDDRVVLGAAGKHLQSPAHFFVATDDRVELALAGQLGEIAGVLGQRLVALFSVRIGDPLAAAHLGQRLQNRVAIHARLAQYARGRAEILGQKRQQQVLAGDVLVLEFVGLASCLVEQVFQATAQICLRRSAAHLRLGRKRLVHLAQEPVGICAHLAQHRQGHALFLGQERAQKMLGRDLLMRVLLGHGMRGRKCLLRLDGKFIEPHG